VQGTAGLMGSTGRPDGPPIKLGVPIGDIAAGMIAAAESDVEDGTAINLGTIERTTVMDAVQEVLRYTGQTAEIKLLRDMPTGPMNRVASNELARRLIGWEPKVSFVEGLHRTIDWYYSTKDRDTVRSYFGRMLTERGEVQSPALATASQ